MTYARARLLIGISGVGTVVTLSAVALVLGWPGTLLPVAGGDLAGDALALGAVLLVHALVLVPFDVLGGHVLPRRFGRTDAPLGEFLASWARGVAAQGVVVLSAALAVLAAGRAGGVLGAAGAFVAAMLVLVVAQEPVARLVAGLRIASRRGRTATVAARDAGFTGGVVGLPGRERFLVPERWGRVLGPHGLSAQMTRWAAALDTRSRLLGLAVALTWNLLGFLLAALVPGAGVQSVAGLVTLALGFTLWSFLGLLLLPSVSRRAVFAVDRRAREIVPDDGVLEETLARLDREQDDEPERSEAVESVFHPIPALSRRLAALSTSDAPRVGPWHAARTALYLSWAGLGLLSRAVHCNAGRPELWALPPCD